MGKDVTRTINVAGRSVTVPSTITGGGILNAINQGSGKDLVRVNPDGTNKLIYKNARIQVQPGERFETQPVVEDGR